MNPSEKSPTISNYLNAVSGRTVAIRSNQCIPPPFGCGKLIGSFTDMSSYKEYTISGLCQNCQNEIFYGEVPANEE